MIIIIAYSRISLSQVNSSIIRIHTRILIWIVFKLHVLIRPYKLFVSKLSKLLIYLDITLHITVFYSTRVVSPLPWCPPLPPLYMPPAPLLPLPRRPPDAVPGQLGDLRCENGASRSNLWLEFSPSWALCSNGNGTHFWRFPKIKKLNNLCKLNIYCTAVALYNNCLILGQYFSNSETFALLNITEFFSIKCLIVPFLK